MLDIFRSDAFSVVRLTDAINKIPFVPGRAGQRIEWNEQGVATTSIALEEIEGTLSLLNPSGRGGPGTTIAKEKRTVRVLNIPHYQIDDAIMAEEVQNVRAFGSETAVETVQTMVNQRLAQHVQWRMDPTLEYQRIGALKGIILNADGTTLYNLFSVFNVSAQTAVSFDSAVSASASTGAVRTLCAQIIRTLSNELGGVPIVGVGAFCGDEFWDQLIACKEVRETYLSQQEARELRGPAVWDQFSYGGIVFENYRGSINGTPLIDTEEAHFFPVGVPGLFRTVYAPADYMETVNTIGLPRYAKQYPMPNDKGVALEVQMNALSYCTRPRALLTATNVT
jgi:hypothetical protein